MLRGCLRSCCGCIALCVATFMGGLIASADPAIPTKVSTGGASAEVIALPIPAQAIAEFMRRDEIPSPHGPCGIVVYEHVNPAPTNYAAVAALGHSLWDDMEISSLTNRNLCQITTQIFNGAAVVPYDITLDVYSDFPTLVAGSCDLTSVTHLATGTATITATGIQVVVVPMTMINPLPDTRPDDPVPPGCGDGATPGSQLPNADYWVRFTFSQAGPGPIICPLGSVPAVGCNDFNHGRCRTAADSGIFSGFTGGLGGRFVNTTLASSSSASTGRCCDVAGECTETTPAACVAPSIFNGLGSTCVGNPCRGRCCAADGTCTLTTAAGCVAPNTFAGLGTSCDGTPCQGRCCHQDGNCTLESLNSCVAPSTFGGLGTTCSANGIECKGRCCDGDGFCTNTGPSNCGGVFSGVGTQCSAFGEECLGRCCSPGGTCEVNGPNPCAASGGVFAGTGTTCDGNQCKGRCCLANGTCVAESSPNACAVANGNYTAGQDCSVYTDFVFTTGGVAPGLPMPLPIQDPPVLETINIQTVSGFVGVISDLNVDLQATHTYVGDVGVKLEFNGITVDLITQLGTPIGGFGCPSNDFDVVLDDEATTGSINNVCVQPGPPAATGTFVPTAALSAFDGISPNGDWTIHLDDAATPDTGSLIRWSLHIGRNPGGTSICAPACACKGDMNGSGSVNGADINQFAQCIAAGGGAGCACANINGGPLDVNDVTPFVNHLISGIGPCVP